MIIIRYTSIYSFDILAYDSAALLQGRLTNIIVHKLSIFLLIIK